MTRTRRWLLALTLPVVLLLLVSVTILAGQDTGPSTGIGQFRSYYLEQDDAEPNNGAVKSLSWGPPRSS